MDESALKLLQLECIIASKDKEISLLRGQLAEDVIEQLQDENAGLKQQLASLAAAKQSQQDGAPAPHQQQQQQRAMQAVLQQLAAAVLPPSGALGTTQAAATDDQRDCVVSLNVGGTLMSAALSTLQLVPGSKLGSLCQPGNDSSSSALRDPQGRIFLPYEPEPFAQLLSLLQAKATFGCSSGAYSHLLAQHGSSTHWPYTRELLLHLGLQQQLLQLDGGAPTQHCTNGVAPYAHPHAEARGARDSHQGPGAVAAAAAAAAAAVDAALPAARRHSSPALQPGSVAPEGRSSSRLEWRLSTGSGLMLPTDTPGGGGGSGSSSSTRKSVGVGGGGGFGGDQPAFGAAALLDRSGSGGGGGGRSSFSGNSSSSSRPRAPLVQQQHGDGSKPGAAGGVHPHGEPAAAVAADVAADEAAAAAKAQLAAKQALLASPLQDAADTLPADQVANAALKGLMQGAHRSGHSGQQP